MLASVATRSLAFNFGGQRALVTGGLGVLGGEICSRLAREGVHVTAIVRPETHEAPPGAAEIVRADLTDTAATLAAVREAQVKAGGEPFRLLVNCAGVARFEPYFETSEAAFDLQYAVNIKPSVFLTQHFASAVADAGGGGAVVHVSSQSSNIALKDHLAYSSSKAALDHITRIQALELGAHGIRVNAVRPTVVLTPLAIENWDSIELERMKASIPLGRLAEPADVAAAVAWLLSDEASMITGALLPVDGGRSMGL